MASGVTVHSDCLDAIQDLKLGKEYKYIILNLSKDNSQIIVEKIKSRKPKVEEIDAGPKAGAEAKAGGEVNVSGTNAGKLPVENKSEKELYEEFVEELPETDCRWIVYDFVYEKEGGLRKKLILISWVPENAKIKQKMLFASSIGSIKSLNAVNIVVQATDFDEVSFNTVLEKIEPFTAKAARAPR